MKEDDVLKLVEALGKEPVDSGDWINFSCLFGRLHEGGEDRRPSAGISIDPYGPSFYHCFACSSGGFGSSALVINVLHHYQHHLGQNLGDLLNWLYDRYKEDVDKLRSRGDSYAPKHKKPPPIHKVLNELDTYPERYLDRLRYEGVHPYLTDRGITLETANRWEIGYDDRFDCVTFPVRRPDGKLVGLVGRRTNPGQGQSKYHNYWGFQRSANLLGAQQLSGRTSEDLLVIVEGPVDALKVSQAGFRAVACMCALISLYQIEIIKLYAERAIVFFDNDEAGINGVQIAKDLLNPWISMKAVFGPKGRDPADLTTEEIRTLLSPYFGES